MNWLQFFTMLAQSCQSGKHSWQPEQMGVSIEVHGDLVHTISVEKFEGPQIVPGTLRVELETCDALSSTALYISPTDKATMTFYNSREM